MTGAVWKLIIFTSAVNRIINTSSNGRILLLVYDTCLQTFGVCTHGHMAHIEAIVQFLPHSDQHVRCGPALFPLQRHPFFWNRWYQCLMLLGDGGSLLNCRRNSRCTEQLIHASQIAAHKTLSAPESPISLCYVTDRERRGEWDCSWGGNLNTCCFFPYGKLLNAFSKPWWQIETAPIILIHPVLWLWGSTRMSRCTWSISWKPVKLFKISMVWQTHRQARARARTHTHTHIPWPHPLPVKVGQHSSRRLCPPSFNKTPAKITEPKTRASTWALGSHKRTINMGILTKNAKTIQT